MDMVSYYQCQADGCRRLQQATNDPVLARDIDNLAQRYERLAQEAVGAQAMHDTLGRGLPAAADKSS